VGVITTAVDLGLAGEESEERAVELMAALNAPAAAAMVARGVKACTDVSGFGLLGHLREMLLQSGVAGRLRLGRVPVLPEAWDLAAGAVCGGRATTCATWSRWWPGTRGSASGSG